MAPGLGAVRSDPAKRRGLETSPSTWIDWDRAGRVDVRPPDWLALARLLKGDVLRTGLFVPSAATPSLRGQVAVVLHMPTDAGRLHFAAEVVHVAAGEGFGLQLGRLDAEVRLLFDHFSLYALRSARTVEHPAEVQRWLGGIHRALQARVRRGDATVFGLERDASPKRIREAFERSRRRWRSFLGRGRLTNLVQRVLEDYGLELHALSEQLSQPSRVRYARGRGDAPGRPVARLEIREKRVPTVRRPVRGVRARVYQAVAQGDYAEADQLLRGMVERDPLDEKAQTLLLFVRARQALLDKDVPAAKRLYRAVVEREPDHRHANRELLLLETLA